MIVTLGITSYNSENTILRAINSAQHQEWSDLEIVVVDDQSTDGSWDTLRALAAMDSRIKLVRHSTNKGVAASRNTIIANASGCFVAFLDDDDVAMVDRIRAQVERTLLYEAASGARLVFCYSERLVIKGENSPVHVKSAIGNASPEPFGPAVADHVLGLPDCGEQFVFGLMGSGTMMARRTTFEAVGRFDEKFRRFEEQDYAIRAALVGAHFISVNRPLITQYLTQRVDKSGSKPLHYALLLRDKHHAYLKQRGLYQASRMFARSDFWGSKSAILGAAFTGHWLMR
ncbi:glycosyltransferase family 2 protein [Devosia aurantiaca]|uniref:Glycosyltransferase family 2 protein n=1 Tax=Devosia aurantiaca TaxID=2714858 RepID=A0A6M1SW06_9HYPH|nr:glycosyltransferase family 2 protein [Devosia aurantiaca]NGP18553.1 glycosyltransferase family 2 protein [Devosia aurantiaca]